MRRRVFPACDLLLLLLVPLAAGASAPPARTLRAARFEANRGQADPEVTYLSRGSGVDLYLAGGEARFAPSREPGCDAAPALVRLRLEGSRLDPALEAIGPLPGKVHYYLGADPARWQTGVETCAAVACRGVYPGVDLVWHARSGELEFDLELAAGVRQQRFPLRFAGAQALAVDDEGGLRVTSPAGTLRLRPPVAWQDGAGEARQGVPVRFARRGGDRVDLVLGRHDPARPVTVDPAFDYSTYLGGDGEELGYDLGRDAAGNLYLGGITNSTDFPGASPDPAGYDGFVAKFDPSGSTLLWSAYVGGSGGEQIDGIAVLPGGGVDVVGSTSSTDFPTLAAIQSSLKGSRDGVVLRFDSDGALRSSTYLGGSGSDAAYAADLDCQGNLHVGGKTDSSDFPNDGGIQSGLAGGSDGYLLVMDPTLGSILRSTYLGGSGDDNVNAVVTDPDGNSYVAGETRSGDFPTANAIQTVSGGGQDVFAARVSADGSELTWSTYLGGSIRDWASAIALGPAGRVYVAGFSESANFPVTPGALQTLLGGGSDAIVACIDGSGKPLVWSSFLGGLASDFAYGLAVDAGGDAWLTGGTRSSNFPVRDPVIATNQGDTDAFFSRVSADGSTLVESTFYGGSKGDVGEAVTIDAAGRVAFSGFTESADFPVIAAIQSTNQGGPCDLFITGQTSAGVDPATMPALYPLRGAKSPLPADMHFEWPAGAAPAFNLWRTDVKSEIPNASAKGMPPQVVPVPGCNPAAAGSCDVAGGAPGAAGEVGYFQVRGRYCGGLEGM